MQRSSQVCLPKKFHQPHANHRGRIIFSTHQQACSSRKVYVCSPTIEMQTTTTTTTRNCRNHAARRPCRGRRRAYLFSSCGRRRHRLGLSQHHTFSRTSAEHGRILLQPQQFAFRRHMSIASTGCNSDDGALGSVHFRSHCYDNSAICIVLL